MLSILIPTYDYDCRHLVNDLHGQAEQAGIKYEIIVADDASPTYIYKERNREINRLSHCRFIELAENVGRARIRNRLADEAQYEWLLFMDCDAEVISPTFLTDYLCHTDAEVICGGLCHADTLPSPTVSLRYAYEKRADKRRPARYRSASPYEQFTSFNFLILQKLFQTIRFDETIYDYGHEDTLFGIALQHRRAVIRHIDNPLRHVGLENNCLFLEKTRLALRNLASMEGIMQGHSSLINAYRQLCRFRLQGLVAAWFCKHEQRLVAHLTGLSPHLIMFFIYKLGYYCAIKSGCKCQHPMKQEKD
ncbi:MAG: glycosyltransferase family 2 protein [Bacteroidaceae bacterium]|nr:glycosyltransferase family 2 protein [Bacteroidaceae bacterium]